MHSHVDFQHSFFTSHLHVVARPQFFPFLHMERESTWLGGASGRGDGQDLMGLVRMPLIPHWHSWHDPCWTVNGPLLTRSPMWHRPLTLRKPLPTDTGLVLVLEKCWHRTPLNPVCGAVLMSAPLCCQTDTTEICHTEMRKTTEFRLFFFSTDN